MSFLTPIAFAAFALSLPLVLLYFLKVRRRERRPGGARRPRRTARCSPAPCRTWDSS